MTQLFSPNISGVAVGLLLIAGVCVVSLWLVGPQQQGVMQK